MPCGFQLRVEKEEFANRHVPGFRRYSHHTHLMRKTHNASTLILSHWGRKEKLNISAIGAPNAALSPLTTKNLARHAKKHTPRKEFGPSTTHQKHERPPLSNNMRPFHPGQFIIQHGKASGSILKGNTQCRKGRASGPYPIHPVKRNTDNSRGHRDPYSPPNTQPQNDQHPVESPI